MRKFTTTLAVLFTVLSTAAFATKTGDSEEVKVKSVDSEKVELTYLSKGDCKVKVNIYDEAGSIVFAESIKQPKSFKRAYDLSKLPEGEYEMEIIDNEKVVVEKISRNVDVDAASKVLSAKVIKEDGEKYKVMVHGAIYDPVAINIYNKFGQLVYGDLIDINKSFSKVYDLSKRFEKDLKFEIIQNGEVLAEAAF